MYVEHCVKKLTLEASELDKQVTIDDLQGRSSIPNTVKNHSIKQVLKIRMNDYKQKLNDYRQICALLIEEYKQNLYKIEAKAALKNTKVDQLSLPPRPKPNYVINEAEFRILINETIQRRKEWELLLRKKRRTVKFSA